jgi:hypothetical protein
LERGITGESVALVFLGISIVTRVGEEGQYDAVKQGKEGRDEQARKLSLGGKAGTLKKREAKELAARTCASGSTSLLNAAEALA